ncbi:hypothetical protein [Draconibacterium sp.]|uniref:hypothetical protein n=1 Tax=Draconibacterium sp. TaxID=1965318 RepID=UPI00356747F2
MKILFVISCLLLASNVLFGQNSWLLISKGDTLNVSIQIKKKKSEELVYFKYSYHHDWHLITADNADAVELPGKEKYISVSLPSVENKVWAMCLFDGTYKLVKYKSAYYIITETDVYFLEPPTNSKSKNRFKGIFGALLYEDIDFDINELTYNSQSLVKPLILFHEKNNLWYKDYNRYRNKDTSVLLEGSYSYVKGNMNLSLSDNFSLNGQALTLGLHRSVMYPDFSKKIAFSLGAKVNAYSFNDYVKKERLGGTDYIDINNYCFSAGGDAAICFQFLDLSSLNLSLRSGIEVFRMFSSEQRVRLETLVDDVVETSYVDLSVDDRILLYQINQLLIEVPDFSKRLRAGVGVSIPLNKKVSEVNTFGINHSILFSVIYEF